VTALRAHVEVDEQVGLRAVEVAEQLKEEWKGKIDVQIAGKKWGANKFLLVSEHPSAFAQKPMFDAFGEYTKVYGLMLEAAKRPNVAVVGSAPYVERTQVLREQNINEILNLAVVNDKGIDFHMDYDLKRISHLDGEDQPLLFNLLSTLTYRRNQGSGNLPVRLRHITIGHATRFSQLTDAEWISFLRDRVSPSGAEIHFVGLPQSDVYMMGKTEDDILDIGTDRDGSSKGCGIRVRGTLDIPRLDALVKQLRTRGGLDRLGSIGHDWDMGVCVAVNNVGNPFTPQGTPDPLSLCPLGLCTYQNATSSACWCLLVSCVIIILNH
jgi:hypothetical protein